MLCELTSVGPGALTIYRNVSGRFTLVLERHFCTFDTPGPRVSFWSKSLSSQSVTRKGVKIPSVKLGIPTQRAS